MRTSGQATDPSRVWLFAVFLAIGFAAMRVVGVLWPGLRWLLPLSFVLMALTPYLLLDAARRRHIGLKAPAHARVFATAIAAGATAAFACFAIGHTWFGDSADNWFVTIGNSYRQMLDTTDWPVARLHLFFTVPAIIFSPIGEEIFFRGYLQDSLEHRFSVRTSTLAECAAFGAVHICHHGLLLSAGVLSIRPVSGSIWMLLMFSAAMLFAYLRKTSGSLLPAIAAHAVFNLVMNVTIFEFLW